MKVINSRDSANDVMQWANFYVMCSKWELEWIVLSYFRRNSTGTWVMVVKFRPESESESEEIFAKFILIYIMRAVWIVKHANFRKKWVKFEIETRIRSKNLFGFRFRFRFRFRIQFGHHNPGARAILTKITQNDPL